MQAKIIKAETFDVMQYFYGSVHEPLIHCRIRFAGHVDETVLKKAVDLSIQTVPLLQCCFDVHRKKPCWVNHHFTASDIVFAVQAEGNWEEQAEKLLAYKIDIANEPQAKIILIQAEGSDTLCIIMNHMVCDGAGFKEYLYLLCNLYNAVLGHPDEVHCEPAYPRNAGQVYKGFSFLQKLDVIFCREKLPTSGDQLAYPLQGDSHSPFFATRLIPEDLFLKVKAYTAKKGVTFNDMVLAAYSRVLHKVLHKDTVMVPCPVDLRKYLSKGQKHGICNLTSNYICTVNFERDESFEKTLTKISDQIKKQKASIHCLKGVMLLDFGYHVLPFRLLQRVFEKAFVIPVVSFTNLGMIDEHKFIFGKTDIADVYITSAVKYVPYFQMAVSTYKNRCTISSNLYGTLQDRAALEYFLEEVKKQLASCVS